MSRLLLMLGLILLMAAPLGVAQAQEGPTGTAVMSDGQALSDQITVTLQNVPPPAENTAYEGWLLSDDGQNRLSIGVLTLGAGGTVDHVYVSPNGENLIANYSRFQVTVEPVPDTDPAPSAQIAWSDAVPGGVISNVRLLVVAGPDDPEQGILTNLQEQLNIALQHADLARNSDNLDTLRMHTHHVINIIEGQGGPNFDAAFGNPGDGVGVLSYAQGRQRASQVAAAGQVVQPHAALVVDYAGNAEEWSILARDQALEVLNQTNINSAKVLLSTVYGTLAAALSGNAATNEGGAEQAYVEAQRMATYVVPGRSDTGLVGLPGGTVGLPSVGDTAVPAAAKAVLIASLALLSAGAVLLVRDRRSRRKA